MKMTELQFRLIKANLKVLTSKPCFYKEKFKDIDRILSRVRKILRNCRLPGKEISEKRTRWGSRQNQTKRSCGSIRLPEPRGRR